MQNRGKLLVGSLALLGGSVLEMMFPSVGIELMSQESTGHICL